MARRVESKKPVEVPQETPAQPEEKPVEGKPKRGRRKKTDPVQIVAPATPEEKKKDEAKVKRARRKAAQPLLKKKRGRPKKQEVPGLTKGTQEETKKRGRPKKVHDTALPVQEAPVKRDHVITISIPSAVVEHFPVEVIQHFMEAQKSLFLGMMSLISSGMKALTEEGKPSQQKKRGRPKGRKVGS